MRPPDLVDKKVFIKTAKRIVEIDKQRTKTTRDKIQKDYWSIIEIGMI